MDSANTIGHHPGSYQPRRDLRCCFQSNDRFPRGTGYPFTNTAQDVWALTNANGIGGTPTWIQLAPLGTPPGGRWVNPIDNAYDAASNRLIIYGGVKGKPNDRFTYGDSWVLTNANGLTGTPVWQQLNPTGSLPVARVGASAFYDSATNRLGIYGGTFDPGDFPTLSDTWVLSNANGIGIPFWQQVLPQGTVIPGRRYGQGVYDRLRNIMSVYGGQLTAGASLPTTSETWALSNANGLGISQQLKINSITPNHGGNSGTITVQVTGSGFQSGAMVKLTGIGQDIIGSNTQVIDSGLVTTTFSLTQVTAGVRGVVLINPDSSSASLGSGFTIDQGGGPQLWGQIVGRTQIRIGSAQTFYIGYGNLGTTDALGTKLIVYVPTSVAPNLTMGNSNGVITTAIQGSTTLIMINLGRVSAGSTSLIPVLLTAGSSQTPFQVQIKISGH